MQLNATKRKNSIDKFTLIVYLLLIVCGWLNIYGASYSPDQTSIFDLSCRSGMQFVWIGVSLLAATVIVLMDYKVFTTFPLFFYAAILVLLVVTAFVAPDIKGSRSWLQLGPISVQPAEFAKFVTALMLAKVMSEYNFKLRGVRNYLKVALVIFAPMAAILLEKETGSALVFAAFVLMLYREGLPGLVPLLGLLSVAFFVLVIRFNGVLINDFSGNSLGLLICFCLTFFVVWCLLASYTREKKDRRLKFHFYTALGVAAISLIVNIWVAVPFVYVALGLLLATIIYLFIRAFELRQRVFVLIAAFAIGAVGYIYSTEYFFTNILQNHQRSRIEVVLGLKDDPSGVGYNVNQAKIAIGSGGFVGKGFLKGTQTKLKYVPEQDTDFIFCTVGEEFGFLGSVAVILLYVLLLWRLVSLAERQTNRFSRIYGYCVMSVFLFHMFVNIGMVMGLLPVIGIPLPFLSYGGSSMLSFTILLFIFLRFDMAR